jgi:fatty acyl-CoA reductase
MVGTMDEARIIEYFKNKSILITGSTGFLGKSMHACQYMCSLNVLKNIVLHMHYKCSSAVLGLLMHVLLLHMHAVLVEKILRVQPDVRKIYLPVRAVDAATAKQRMQTEVCCVCMFCFI